MGSPKPNWNLWLGIPILKIRDSYCNFYVDNAVCESAVDGNGLRLSQSASSNADNILILNCTRWWLKQKKITGLMFYVRAEFIGDDLASSNFKKKIIIWFY